MQTAATRAIGKTVAARAQEPLTRSKVTTRAAATIATRVATTSQRFFVPRSLLSLGGVTSVVFRALCANEVEQRQCDAHDDDSGDTSARATDRPPAVKPIAAAVAY